MKVADESIDYRHIHIFLKTMFRVSLQATRRVAFRSARQIRFYSAHPPSGGVSHMNKPALLLAGFSTLGAIYVADGCPTLIERKPAPAEKPAEETPAAGQSQSISEPTKDADESPVSAQEEGAEPVTTPENEITYSEETHQALAATLSGDEPAAIEPVAESVNEQATEPAASGEATNEPVTGISEDTKAPSLSFDDSKTAKGVVLEDEADKKEIQQTSPDAVKTASKDGSEGESDVVLHEKSPAEAETITEAEEQAEIRSISGGTAEQSATAAAAAAGVQGEKKNEQQTAYNPETGEINWDCPCLGGMAYGPCGEEFKSAFSCFVYSEADPKGINCVEKFSTMQNCFRKYPDYYAEQIKDEEEASAEASKIEDKSTTPVSTATSTVEVQTENAVFEPVLEKYVEENPQLKDTPEAAAVTNTDDEKK